MFGIAIEIWVIAGLKEKGVLAKARLKPARSE
jgi:hypothetical protein